MARIVTKPFVLNLPTGEKKPFAVGAIVEDEVEADHWYVKAHSDEIAEEAEAEPAPADEADKPKRRKAKEAEATAEPAPADEAKE